MTEQSIYEIREFSDPSGQKNTELIARNEHLGIKMQICPPFIAREDAHKLEWQKGEFEVMFLDDKVKHAAPIGSYFITKSDIPSLDTDNKDLLEEVLTKYAKKFSTITQYKDFNDLIGQIFIDIDEQRKRRSIIPGDGQ